MRKNKDGTIIASLTEVKNKTGDIFALADEYGEVILTSYNKPRYKLIKLNVSSLLEDESAQSKQGNKVKTVNQNKPPQIVAEKKVEVKTTQREKDSTSSIPVEIENASSIKIWDRDSEQERDFILNITKTLI